jgi:predicted DsbA family dithiol-disulfide isomerase
VTPGHLFDAISAAPRALVARAAALGRSTRAALQDDRLHFRLLGFVSTLLVLSLALNVYLLWAANRDRVVEYLSRFRFPAAVSGYDHVRGPADARVTVIVYADFRCPYCRELHASLKAAASTESFRWVYRHFPLPNHRTAEQYAQAAECAGAQGKFWDFTDRLYEAPGGSPTGDLPAIARESHLDVDSFRACLDRGDGRSTVRAQKAEGDSLWISGTPTFFVNGQRFNGLVPADRLRAVLRAHRAAHE